jgi:hypothetical protein
MTECKRCERTLQLNSTKFITAKAARFGLCYWCWKDLTPEQRKTYLEDYNPFTDEHAIAKDRKTIEKLNIEYREICKCDNPKPTMGYIETCSKCNISRPKKKPVPWHCHYNFNCEFFVPHPHCDRCNKPIIYGIRKNLPK